MGENPVEQGPARPLVGYRDTGAEEVPDTRDTTIRSWVILVFLVAIYLGWTLTVYFIEPGLR